MRKALKHLRPIRVIAFFAMVSSISAGSLSIDFENLTDSTILTDQYATQYGVTFSNTLVVNALVLSSRISLNEFEFPPHSGTNVVTDNGGPMAIKFANPVFAVGGYFTYGEAGVQNFTHLTIQAFDSSNNLIGSVSSAFSNNEALSGDPGSSPNTFLQVSAAAGISYVVITGDPNGGSFALDDLTITASAPVPAITSLTPGSGQQGQQNLSVTITGQLTSWTQGTTTASFGAGITVKSLTVNSTANATVVVSIDSTAGLGPRTVTLTTGSEVASLANGFTVNPSPDLTVTMTHTGNFVQGQSGAVYTITVNNAGNAAASGLVTVSDTLPVGLTPVAMGGAGWTCPTGALTSPVSCTRSDALAPAASYAALTLTVNVAANAPASLTNTVAVSGGGEVNTSNDTASDLTSVNASACLAPLSGLVSWWTGDGTTSDALGLNHPSASNAVSFVPAQVGTGFAFGQGGYVDIPASASLANQQFSWAAWARPDGAGPNNDQFGSAVVDQSIDGTHVSVYVGWRATDNRFVFVFGEIYTEAIASQHTFVPGQLYLVAATYDGSIFKLFVNGALEGQLAAAKTIPYSSISWTIGASSPNIRSQAFPRTWNGVIDEVQAFNRALSQAEIQAIYAAGGAGECKSQPAVTSVAPNTSQQGRQNLSVALAGTFTNWVQGTTTASFGTGITVSALTVNSATSATATLNIDAAAATGARNVTLTTNAEMAALANGFTVTPAVNQPPTVSAGANQTIPLGVSEIAFAEYPGPSGAGAFEGGIVMQEVTPGPDGNLWFTEGYEFGSPTQIGKMTPAGAITLYSVPSGSSEGGITAGPDGNLWFTEYRTGKIGRITTAGVVTEFSIPTGTGSYPNAITAGPDGNLWFTEVLTNKIGRITPAGVFAEFPASNPVGITAGPDGNLWFTENTANRIGRITPAGVVTEFPVPTSGSLPFKITAGPDGNLWFTEQAKIGRITPAGAITEFPVATGGGQPAWITKGSDGNLWFTVDGNTSNQIGSITPAGVVTLFAEPTPSSRMGGITAGPGGSLWFVEGSANKIGSATFGLFYTATAALTGSLTDDGLPAGATLTATWSTTSGPGPVTFSNPTATFPDVAGQVNPVTTSATFSVAGTYVLGLTGSDSLLSGSSSVTITVNPLPVSAILSVSPNTGQQGQQNVTVGITGQYTHFEQGITTANFGAGITTASLTVNSPTVATSVVNIDPAAATGARSVTLTTGAEVATLANGFTVGPPPDLTITKTHSGTFTPGDIGATYTITVTNSGTGPTVGLVTVSDTLPAGLSPTAISGMGWTCPTGILTSPVACTRSDPLASATSYPMITLTVNVANNAPASVTNTAVVSGGGETNTSNDSASDFTAINALVTGNLITNGTFDTNATGWILGGGCGDERWVSGIGNPPGSVLLNACGESNSDPTASQTVSGLTPGETYVVSVDVMLYINSSGANGKSFGIFVDNEPGNPIFLGEFLDGAWHTVTASFTATSSSHTIIFAAELDARTPGVTGSSDVSYYIDNVSLATVAITTGPPVGTYSNGEVDGWQFTAASNFTISALGAWGTTFTAPHQVGLWTNAGTLIVSALVSPTDNLVGGFRYHPLASPVQITAGQTYIVGADSGSDAIGYGNTETRDPRIGSVAALYHGCCGFHIPDIAYGHIDWGANFLIGGTSAAQGADLAISKTHSGSFVAGQTGGVYTLSVNNVGTGPTVGVVTATDALPAGLTATAISGTGWSCTLATLLCTRSDVLAAGSNYPPITLTVNVAANAPTSVTNTATVSGGGEANPANDFANDVTAIGAPPDLTIAKTHTGNFIQGQTGATYSIAVNNVGASATAGQVSVADSLPTGVTATAIGGAGWSCVLGTVTCTRSDPLAAGASYPAITVTVNVAGNAPASVTNTATVSGGGELNTSNDTTNDVTTVNSPPDLTITKTHSGNFKQGDDGDTYTITVTNIGGTPTSGLVTMSDTLPAGLSAAGINGTGWTCVPGTLTCTRSDSLAAGASYSPISLTVSVANNAPALLTNTANVSGGGELNTANNTANDVTTVNTSLQISVSNPSFENHNPFTISDSRGIWNNGPITGWNSSGDAGEYQPTPATLIPLDGTVVAWAHVGTIWQDLSARVTPGLTYVLTVGVGRGLGYNNSGYAVRLKAGNVTLAEDLHTAALPVGWQTSRVVYTSPPNDPNAGIALRIELAAFGSETEFDAVTLSGQSGLDPGTTVTGRVVDSASHPVAGASVTVLTFSTTSAADGTFNIAGVPALNGNLVVRASATVAGVFLSGQSAATAPVPGGITNVGSITLTSIPVITSISPKSALAGTTITPFTVGGLNLSGSTFAFSPSSGMTISGVSIAANGTSATFNVAVSAAASGRFTVVATNAAGPSDSTPGLGFLPGTASFNTLTVPGSDPNADPDKDGLTNSREIQLGTDPLNADTDGDTYVDGLEVTLGSDPLNPNSVPNPYGSGWFASPIMSMLNNANPGVPLTGTRQYVSGLTFSMLNSLNPSSGVAGSNHYVSSLTFSILNNLNPSTGVAGSNRYVSSPTFSILNNLNPSTGVAGSNHYVSSLTFSILNNLNPSIGVAGSNRYVSSLTFSILNGISPAPTTPSQRFVNGLVFSIANGVPARSAELVTSLFTVGTIAERAARPWLFLDATHGALDSDGDGISDEDEMRLGTNPFDPDTDHDGYPDGLEVALGSDPRDPNSIPNINPPGFVMSPAVIIQNYFPNYIILGMRRVPVLPAELRRQP